jgi:hypothetical protein
MADHAATGADPLLSRGSFLYGDWWYPPDQTSVDEHSFACKYTPACHQEKFLALVVWSDQPDALRMHAMHVLKPRHKLQHALTLPLLLFSSIPCPARSLSSKLIMVYASVARKSFLVALLSYTHRIEIMVQNMVTVYLRGKHSVNH